MSYFMHIDRHVDGTILTASPGLHTHLKQNSEQHVASQCVAFILITLHILKNVPILFETKHI
jgi:hypothetical protein